MTYNRKHPQTIGRRLLLFVFSLLTKIIFLESYFYLTKTTVDTQRQMLKAEAQNAAEHINIRLRRLVDNGDRPALALSRADGEEKENYEHSRRQNRGKQKPSHCE